jgi:preprotein translocase subunit SecY
MWTTLKNAWRIVDLRKKIIYTVLMLLVYRLMCYVPTPGIDIATVQSKLQGLDLLNFMNTMTGSNLENFTIMAMGITPYINSSIIMQLLTVAIPKLEELQKSGEDGRKKIAQITRYVTIGLGFLQAVALSYGLGASSGGFGSYLLIGVCLAAGTAMAMWIGERINDKGIGNGISLLIFAGIIARLATTLGAYFSRIFDFASAEQGLSNPVTYLAVIVIALVMIVAVVFVDLGERRVPIQYAKRMVGRKMYGGQQTFIPLRINSSGVMPLIFASAIMQFPSTIFSFMPQSSAAIWWSTHIGTTSLNYQLIFALMIVGFTFFYSTISFNPIEISKNIQQNGGMIPGIRQGKPTSDFIQKISNRITLFGALFLAVLATLPVVVSGFFRVSLPFAASSLLIAVSVAMETTRQLESQMLMRHYKGFLK